MDALIEKAKIKGKKKRKKEANVGKTHGKYVFVSYTKHAQRKINGSTSFAIDNMYYVNFRI